jgi:hypothetical protein
MPSTYTSPYASAFKSAIKRGTSWNVAVNNIASRNNKSPEAVWASLYKADLCFRQKFNGKWIYVPWTAKKTNATTSKGSQFNSWQWFTEWCIASGYATPEQFKKNAGSQKEFMTWCRKFFGKQFTTSTTSSTTKRRSTRKSTSRKSSTSRRRTSSSYKFPSSRTSSRRRTTRRAA